MKNILFASLLLSSSALLHANPEIASVVRQDYGTAAAEGIVLLQSAASAGEPGQWTVYAMDPFRPGELVRAELNLQGGSWAATPSGAGSKLLGRVPPQPLAFNRVRLRSADARRIAQQQAVLAKTSFVSAQYQLAANANGSPEWGVALLDTAGGEIGFIVISAETGAVIHQQWSNGLASNTPGAPVNDGTTPGERVADDVKRGARRAWEWTGDTGVEVGRFFKRLFRND